MQYERISKSSCWVKQVRSLSALGATFLPQPLTPLSGEEYLWAAGPTTVCSSDETTAEADRWEPQQLGSLRVLDLPFP